MKNTLTKFINILFLLSLFIVPSHAYSQGEGLYKDTLKVRRESIKAYQEGDFMLAVEKNLEALKLIPDHPGLHTNQVTFYIKAGDFDNALLYLEKYVSMGLKINLENFEFTNEIK